ncbi:MAG TPA: ABC transporter permease [Nocardioidaceae bacterium]|nr:ABC transporter permease [Nocardioidaceae bacterium]
MDWQYLSSNSALIWSKLVEHLYLSITPILIALVLSLLIGLFSVSFPKVYPAVLALSSTFYTVPSIALFVMLPGIIQTNILSPLNVIVALSIYSVSLLVRNVVDGLRETSADVRQSALSMGYGGIRQLWEVDLPIAMPLIFAGLRVATVANISMVSVGALVGIGGLGELMADGFRRNYLTPLLVGLVLSVVLALTADLVIVTLQRWLTPWAKFARQA